MKGCDSMRDYVSNPTEFYNQVERRIKQLVTLDIETLRSDVVDNSNSHWDNLTFFYLKGLGMKDFIRLGIVSWYLPEEIGILLRVDLEEKLKFLAKEDRILCQQFLFSKARMLIFLKETTLWHTRDFFGNILGTTNNLNRFFKLSPLRRKVKRPQRKRGYDDKGSKVSDEKWKPKFDFTLTELQNQIEQERKSLKDTQLFIEGFLI